MKVFFYNADIYCEDCGEDIKQQIRNEAKAAGKLLKEYLDVDALCDADTDTWPQLALDGGGESDSPQHCGSHECCLNATLLKSGNKVGMFLENSLISDGNEYVKEQALNDIKSKGEVGEVVQMWLDYYDYIKLDDSEEVEDQDET